MLYKKIYILHYFSTNVFDSDEIKVRKKIRVIMHTNFSLQASTLWFSCYEIEFSEKEIQLNLKNNLIQYIKKKEKKSHKLYVLHFNVKSAENISHMVENNMYRKYFHYSYAINNVF